MKIIIHSALAFFTALILVSCKQEATLQRYFVDHQESKNFITQDIPISMLKIDESQFTEEQKEAYNSVSRLNLLVYKVGDKDAETLKDEIAKVKTILSDDRYKDLMEFNNKGNKVLVKYIGSDEDADEVIVFGSSKEMGFGVVRVLGNGMDPNKMATLVSVLQSANVDKEQFKEVFDFFK